MSDFQTDIYTEPANIDINTLDNLGPLRALAGTWRGRRGVDVKPKADGPRTQGFVETIDLRPIDPVTNGPQLLYGLRYHTHIVKPDQVKTYHEQVGYWLWEPATQTVIHSFSIPRGMMVMAEGKAAADAKQFQVKASHDSPHFGIRAAPFLDHAFKTVEFIMTVTAHEDGTWSYEEDTVLQIKGQTDLFHHTDRNTLSRMADPIPNPLAKG